jgi:hypothetical protein
MSGMIAYRRKVRFDGIWHPVWWGFRRVYLEGGSDAHSGFGHFDDCDVFDGGARTGPDLRSGLSGLPACLPVGGVPLLRLQLHLAASVQCVGIGPLGRVRHQSIFCWRGRTPRGLSAASPRLLKRLTTVQGPKTGRADCQKKAPAEGDRAEGKSTKSKKWALAFQLQGQDGFFKSRDD